MFLLRYLHNFYTFLFIFGNVIIKMPELDENLQTRRIPEMNQGSLQKILGLLIVFLFSIGAFAQQTSPAQPKTQEVFVVEEEPVIIKHLPDWKTARNRAVYISNSSELRQALGERPIFDLISFEGGTEAVTANYDAGKLLIVEYTTPQFSIDADNKIRERLTADGPAAAAGGPIYFRRVGNYEVFVFDASDEAAANALIDQVKYEKSVQWLGEDPFLYQRAERAYLKLTGDMFISTILSIALGLGLAVFSGIAIGIFVFYLRKQKRASMTAFSDAGGMVRLNLDELSADISAHKLLKD
jgi:hypothetical protein